MFLRGWAMAEQGQVAAGITQGREGTRIYEGTGNLIGMSLAHLILAKSYGLAEMPGEGIAALARASALPGGTMIPRSASETTSGVPPVSEPTTGRPEASASRAESGVPSLRLGRTNASQAASHSGMSR